MKEALELLPLARTVMDMRPKTVKRAPVQQVVLKGDRHRPAKLPIQTCWPGEPAPLITWPLVVTKGPSTSREDDFNLGIYRMQVIGKDRTIMRWLAHRGGAQHHRRWKGAGKREPLPACAVIGADPGTILAAVTPVPDTLSEYQFAGLLRGAPRSSWSPAKTAAAAGPGPGRDRDRGPGAAGRLRRRGPLRRPHRLLQLRRARSRCSRSPPSPCGKRPDLPDHLHRPAAGRALGAGRGAERGVHPAAAAAVPRDRRLLAAAGGLQLPHRGGVDEEGLPRPRQAGDDGRLVATCASSCTPSG